MKHVADDFARSNRIIWQCQDLSTLCGCWARLHRVDWSQIETSFHARTGRMRRHDGSLGGAAFVAMMQSSDLGERDDLAGSRSPRHVSPNGGLADLNTEHEQFAVNARRPPDGVGDAHLADQFPDSCSIFGRPIWRDLDRHRQ